MEGNKMHTTVLIGLGIVTVGAIICFAIGSYHWKGVQAMKLGYEEEQPLSLAAFMWKKIK